MLKRLIIFLSLSAACAAATFNCTPNVSGNFSSASIYNSTCNGGIPDNGRADGNIYIVTVNAGITLTMDTGVQTSASWGSAGSAVGAAFTINGSSAVSRGAIIIPNGFTLNTSGNSTDCSGGGSNSAGIINNFGLLQGNSGGAWAPTTCWYGPGRIVLDATGGSAFNFGNSAIAKWNNSVGSTASGNVISGTATYGFTKVTNHVLDVWYLAHQYVSNAAGTGLGSCGNTSLSLTGTGGDTLTEICPIWPTIKTWDQTVDPFVMSEMLDAAGPGHYYVDYYAGTLVAYLSTANRLTTQFNYTMMYGSATADGPVGVIVAASSDSELILRNVNAQWCGFEITNAPQGACFWVKQNPMYGTGSTQNTGPILEITNSSFSFTGVAVTLGPMGDTDYAHPVLINNNKWSCDMPVNSGGTPYPCIAAYPRSIGTTAVIQNIQFNGNLSYNENGFFGFATNGNVWLNASKLSFDNNYFLTEVGFQLVGAGPATCSDCDIGFNINVGYHGSGSQHSAPNAGIPGNAYGLNFGGTSGHPVNVHDNVIAYVERGGFQQSWTNNYNNSCFSCGHHIWQVGPSGVHQYITNYVNHNNVGVDHIFNCGASVNFGYNNSTWIDNMSAYNDTFINRGCAGIPTINVCDQDGSYNILDTHSQAYNNLVVGSNDGFGPLALSSSQICKAGFDVLQNNAFYNTTTNYLNVVGGAVITQSGVAYNSSGTKNVTGSTLWNASANTTTGSLQFIPTSTSNVTAAWSTNNGSGYGTAQQLIFGGSGTTYTLNAAPTFDISPASNITSFVTMQVAGSPGWSTSGTSTSCPLNMFLVMITGASAGQVAAIYAVAPGAAGASTISVMPPHTIGSAWTFNPANGDSFVIVNSEIMLPDQSSSVTAIGNGQSTCTGTCIVLQMDPRTWPTTGTQTDSNITIASANDLSANPNIISPAQAYIFGQYAPSNSLYCTGGVSSGNVAATCRPIWMADQ